MNTVISLQRDSAREEARTMGWGIPDVEQHA